MKRVALVRGTIYTTPADEPLRDGALLIEGSNIAWVGSGAEIEVFDGTGIVDCSGCSIVAGFWNSHVHFFERKWADAASIPADELQRQLHETFTRFGFTTVFDTGSMFENTRAIRDRIESGEVTGPRIFSTGEALLPPGALPPPQVLAALGYVNFPAPEISGAADAQLAADQLLQAGADAIKVFPSSPRGGSIPENAIAAAAAVSHRAKKRIFAHPDSADDIVTAVRAGVNVVAHTTPRSGPWDAALLNEMRSRGVALTPTLALWKALMRHDRISVADRLTQTAVEQLRMWHGAGGTVLFGTDVGAAGADPCEEYALMRRAGMRFEDILASLTTAPAAFFGFGDRSGRVAPGLDADLTILDADPMHDADALDRVRCVIRGGRVIAGALPPN